LNAAAFVVGPREGAGPALAAMARNLGFSSVAPYQGLARAEAQLALTPLVLFLCAAVHDLRRLGPLAEAIRFSGNAKLKFSPLIYFTADASLDTIRQCVRMGFDDVVALPIAQADLGGRVARQVGSIKTYYETSTYFGPDRRNRMGNARSADSDHGGGQYRRIEIIRNPLTGTDVLRDDFQVVI
jgi:CheY-like chemotaxis protein